MKKNKIFSIANTISLSRIVLCLPLIYYLESDNYLYSSIIISIMIFSDIIDGFIARKTNTITNFGKLLDPLADKIAIIIVLIYLTFNNPYGYLMILLILLQTLRDCYIITIGTYLMNSQNIVFESNLSGKWYIFVSSVMMISFIYNFYTWISISIYLLTIYLMFISTIEYINRYNKLFKINKK